MHVFAIPIQLAIVLTAVAVTGCGRDSDRLPDGPGGDGPAGDITVELGETAGSGQSGTAALIADGRKTLVVIESNGDRLSEVQAAHIHEGTCDELSPESAFRLQVTTNGRSETTVDVPLDTLTGEPFAIALHKSEDDSASHTLCGNITPAAG